MINFIKNLFQRNQDHDFEINVQDFIPAREPIDLYLPEERLIESFDPSKKSIVIIDDSKGVTSIMEDFVTTIINENDYNILTFFGTYAPFVLRDTLTVLESKGLKEIEYAILDIVLPGKIIEDDKLVKMDGVDVSILLNKKYNCNKFVFYSGNVLNAYIDFIEEKIKKFRDVFNKNLKNYIILKTKTDDEVLEILIKLFNNQITL